MNIGSASRSAPGKRPGKQNGFRLGVRGSTMEPKARLHFVPRRLRLRLVMLAESSGRWTLPPPKAAESPLLFAFCCFPHASPAFRSASGKQETAPRDRSKHLNFMRKFGPYGHLPAVLTLWCSMMNCRALACA